MNQTLLPVMPAVSLKKRLLRLVAGLFVFEAVSGLAIWLLPFNLTTQFLGAFWGDYNNDGCLDLYVTNYGQSILYHNGCDGTFRDVTSRAGVANDRWATGAVWFDYNRDGWLDLYVCNYVDFDLKAMPKDRGSLQYGINVPFTLNPASFAPQPNRLYRNNRDGTFTDVAASAGVADAQGRSLVATFADFDRDGWPDLYVGNDISANSLFRNLGNGRFADLSDATGSRDYRGTMGIAVADFDGDGDTDFFLTHWVAQPNALYQNLYSDMGNSGSNLFFADAADTVGVGSLSTNRAVSDKIRSLRREIESEFGVFTQTVARMLGPVLLWTSRREEKRLARGKTYEPRTVIERRNWEPA